MSPGEGQVYVNEYTEALRRIRTALGSWIVTLLVVGPAVTLLVLLPVTGCGDPISSRPPLDIADAGTDAMDADHPEVDAADPEDADVPDVEPPPPEVLVEITYANPDEAARQGEIVTQGVPLPAEAAITDVDELSLIDSEGVVQPSGMVVQSRWGGGPGDVTKPIQWLLVDARLDVAGSQETKLRLVRGGPAPPPSSLTYTQHADRIDIETGSASFEVGRLSFALLNKVAIGGKPMAPSPVTLSLTLAGSPAALSLADFEPDSVQVVQSTDLRLRAKASGPFGPTGGAKQPLRYTAYLDFYEGSSQVRCYFRIENPNAAIHKGNIWLLGSDGSIHVEDLSVRINLKTDGNYALKAQDGVWSTGTAGSVSLYQDSSGGPNWQSDNHLNKDNQIKLNFKGYRHYENEVVVANGQRADGALAGSNASHGVAVAVRHFWQNFPKALRLDPSGMEIGLFPTEFADTHEIQGGEAKTHELLLYFHAAEEDPAVARAVVDRFQRPMLGKCPEQYYADTEALFYNFAPRKDGVADLWETAVDSMVIPTGYNPITMITQRETIDEYGWRHFGGVMADQEEVCGKGGYDYPVSHNNNQNDTVSAALLKFARVKGGRVWYDFGEEHARHHLDIDVYHTDLDTPLYNRAPFGHTTHDAPAGRSTHRAYPEAALTKCSSYPSGGPGLEYIHLDGVVQYGYLSGYPYVFEIVDSIADWVVTRLEAQGGLTAKVRPYSNCVRTLSTAYRLRQNPKHLEILNGLLAVAPLTSDDPGGASWRDAMAHKALGRYLDLAAEFGLDADISKVVRGALLAKADIILDKYDGIGIQSYRFVEVLLYAYKHSDASNPNREAYKTRALQIFAAAPEASWAKGTYSFARDLTIMGTNGNMALYYLNE